MTQQKRTIPQAVFDGPDAIRVSKAGHKQACEELARLHPSQLDPSNPNHPNHDGLFGYATSDLMAKQWEAARTSAPVTPPRVRKRAAE